MSADTSRILSIAQDYIAQGLAVIPIDHKQKAPKIKAWEKLEITADNAARFFNGAEQNIGVQLGARSNGLADVDLDCAEAVRLAPYFLPPTEAVFGRASKPSSHYLFLIDDAPEKATEQLKDENKQTIVELRMGGGTAAAQTVFPGSTHPSGETIEWVKNDAPAKSDYVTLKRAITKIAIGAILMRQWPKGSGHEAALTVGGFLARCGWSPVEIGDFVGVLTREAGDQPTEDDNRRTARDAAQAHANGQHSFGFPKLTEDWGEKSAKAIAKILGYKGEKSAHVTASTDGPAWRERRRDGSPLPTMYNARLAITALGVECSRDTFHNKTFFGYSGDGLQHELKQLVGEVTDDGIIMLRQIMSQRLGVDLEDKATRDAVKSLALEHCFNPVCDMLDEAEKNYDGVARLDRMAVDYFNCDDTPLNRAIVRKAMIAAVRRARSPGCKFDTIIVMESPEGWNKSTAWRVLAGDENFSDESILGRSSREVQEQLSGVWIHENADLAGMRKAEVEHVKAFASRQVDRARPAYGHYVLSQPRHSIEIATTNSDDYLQSQDGNRRFWPLAVRKAIDLDLLRRDRLQLWGEAAKYESEGESIALDEALWPKARDEQEKRRATHPWEDVLAEIPDRVVLELDTTVQIIYCADGQERVASSDLLTHVLGIPLGQQLKKHSMELATIMKLAGWERGPGNNKVTIRGKQVRGYFRWVDGRVLP
ncbi:VapE domain-containing protein [Bradyrhizobium sp. JYMT SZCCT0428]|uniref:VapE domain-containing protein n=1 Tax=Bradyrhizobium sp. JYMT SZCCT0428 TaxID=2807673 RepID=UPI001BAC3B3E|nr:VapE domain-containing protein [Bradyrhizobium sp. JYMT SZCCT0428]MBR1156079.1 bifunctional DNA primase/polymerase [Bradyrhizobium sp. JYMT SZCCT0428]